MTPSPHHAYQIQAVDSIDMAVEAVRKNRMYLEDYETSHTLFLIEQHEERTRLESPIKAAWLAQDPRTQDYVGCALVCEGAELTDGSPTVSLFVHPAHRRKGLGRKLLETALAVFPNAWAFYTPQAQRLYDRHGLETAFFARSLMEEDAPFNPSPKAGRWR